MTRVGKPFSFDNFLSAAIIESIGPLSPAACVCTRATRPAAASAPNGTRAAARPVAAAAPTLAFRKPRLEKSFAMLVV